MKNILCSIELSLEFSRLKAKQLVQVGPKIRANPNINLYFQLSLKHLFFLLFISINWFKINAL